MLRKLRWLDPSAREEDYVKLVTCRVKKIAVSSEAPAVPTTRTAAPDDDNGSGGNGDADRGNGDADGGDGDAGGGDGDADGGDHVLVWDAVGLVSDLRIARGRSLFALLFARCAHVVRSK